jgi:drug/metabolite transporter (DMT)-like permease
MSILASTALVSAESILALTPIVIKKTPVDATFAIWSRILSSAALGYLLSSDRGIAVEEFGGSVALGFANLVHISSSYESFRHLPAGQAMSLLYTYPLWNLVLMSVFGGERIAAHNYLFMGLATAGSFLLNMDPGIAAPTALVKEANAPWGIFMGLLMALSESSMVVLLKILGWRDPAKSVFVVNSSSSVLLALFLIAKELVDHSAGATMTIIKSGATWWDAIGITAFHSITLFSGYWLRYYAVPRLSTVTYAILSYAGLIASYLFGIMFLKEVPGWISVAGAVLIVLSGMALQFSNLAEQEDKARKSGT